MVEDVFAHRVGLQVARHDRRRLAVGAVEDEVLRQPPGLPRRRAGLLQRPQKIVRQERVEGGSRNLRLSCGSTLAIRREDPRPRAAPDAPMPASAQRARPSRDWRRRPNRRARSRSSSGARGRSRRTGISRNRHSSRVSALSNLESIAPSASGKATLPACDRVHFVPRSATCKARSSNRRRL